MSDQLTIEGILKQPGNVTPNGKSISFEAGTPEAPERETRGRVERVWDYSSSSSEGKLGMFNATKIRNNIMRLQTKLTTLVQELNEIEENKIDILKEIEHKTRQLNQLMGEPDQAFSSSDIETGGYVFCPEDEEVLETKTWNELSQRQSVLQKRFQVFNNDKKVLTRFYHGRVAELEKIERNLVVAHNAEKDGITYLERLEARANEIETKEIGKNLTGQQSRFVYSTKKYKELKIVNEKIAIVKKVLQRMGNIEAGQQAEDSSLSISFSSSSLHTIKAKVEPSDRNPRGQVQAAATATAATSPPVLASANPPPEDNNVFAGVGIEAANPPPEDNDVFAGVDIEAANPPLEDNDVFAGVDELCVDLDMETVAGGGTKAKAETERRQRCCSFWCCGK